MAQSTFTNPNQAVYEPHTPFSGPTGLVGATVQNMPVVALHHNADGSFTGVTDEGVPVHIPATVRKK